MMGSASMSARRPMTLSPGSRPRITPTTPVRPMPVTTSSQPNSRSFSGHDARRAMHVVVELGMGVQVPPPGGDLVGECGDAVEDGHEDLELEWERVTTKN